jgi:hypothetical protein
MRIAAAALTMVVAFGWAAAGNSASADGRAGYSRPPGKHHLYKHQSRHRTAVRTPYRGPAITLWQKRYEEPQWNPYDPYGYGSAYAPD